MNHSFQRAFSQKCDLRFVVGCWINRELVAKILERELQSRGKFFGVEDGFRQVGKQRSHLRRRFDVPFAVGGEQAAGVGKSAMVANAGEDIQKFAVLWSDVANAVGGEQR